MANDTIYIAQSQSGLSITVQLYDAATPVGVPIAATEIGTTGVYFATVPNTIPFGYYVAIASDGSNNTVGANTLYWNGMREISPLMYEELWRLQGLDINNQMNVTPTSRTTGDINLAITGDGVTTTTVTRQ